MGRSIARSFPCALVALALALCGAPFGAVAHADGRLAASAAQVAQVAPLEADHVWDGTADASWYSASGTEFTISTPEQLAGLAAIVNGEAVDASGASVARDDFTGKTVTLAADVKLNSYAAEGSQDEDAQKNWSPIGKAVQTGVDYSEGHPAPTYDFSNCFNGTFDGAGHLVENIFRYDLSEEFGGFTGLFGFLGERAVVTRVGVEGGYLYGRVAGGIAAASRVPLSAMDGGGPLIDGCYNSAQVVGNGSSTRAAGGIFGGHEMYSAAADSYQGMARIENCFNKGKVSSPNSKAPLGGIAGYGSVQVSGCLNAAAVEGGGASVRGRLVGAVLKAGYQNGSHTTGVGAHYAGFVKNCNSTGSDVLYHVLAASGDEDKGSRTGVKSSEADRVFPLASLYWFGEAPADGAHVLGGAFKVVEKTGYYQLVLRWLEGIETTEITDGCIVGGVAASYAAGAALPKPVVRIAAAEGVTKLSEGDDYTLTYRDSTGAEVASVAAGGTFTVTATGTGAYSGSASRTFTVAAPVAPPTPAPAKVDLSKKATVTVKSQVYSGRKLTPAPTVKVGKTTLKKNTDYTVTYSANTNVGTATVTVKAASKSTKYKGSKKATFSILPKPTALTKLAKGKKQLTATWKKQATQVTGYQVLLATNGKFTAGKKTVTVKSAKTVKACAKGLKAKTKYWAKVRTYRKVGSKTYYSAWSKAMTAKTS